MALDWNREVSFGRKGAGSEKGANAYPTKTTMNLYTPVSAVGDVRRTVPLAILLALVVVAFVKFGIVDVYSQVAEKQAELTQQQALVSAAEAKLVNYDSVKAEYDSYAISSTGNVNAIKVLDMVEQQIMPSASVTSISLDGTTLKLTLANVSLDTVGNLVKALDAQSMVSDVSVATAATSTGATSTVQATMTITLTA